MEALARATAHVADGVARLTDAELLEPSGLPGWSRAHVVAHLARNADALRNLAHWARTGQERPMYASRAERTAGIFRSAEASAAALKRDFHCAAELLRSDLATVADWQWGRAIHWRHAKEPGHAAKIPWLRVGELEIHHVDLRIGYHSRDWPAEFVDRMLAEVAEEFSLRSAASRTLVSAESGRRWVVGSGGSQLCGPPAELLAWLLGRPCMFDSEEQPPHPGAWR